MEYTATCLFQLYWNYCPRRGELNDLTIFLLTSQVFVELKKIWKANKWDVKELEEICNSIHYHNSAYDPSDFINDQVAYDLHVKNCYYLGL